MECVQYKHRYIIYIYRILYTTVAGNVNTRRMRTTEFREWSYTNIRIQRYNTHTMRNVQRRHYVASKRGVGVTFIYSHSTGACRSRASLALLLQRNDVAEILPPSVGVCTMIAIIIHVPTRL